MSLKRILIATGCFLSASIISTSSFAGNFSGTYSVELNKTEIVRLAEPAAAVSIGNPKIADVSVHSADTIFVLGRGYGQTNLIVLNGMGETILDADIQVTAPVANGNVRLYSGRERETYSCAPNCLPSPVLGDTVNFVVRNTPETREIRSSVISGVSSRAPSSIVGIAVESEPELEDDDPRRPYFPE